MNYVNEFITNYGFHIIAIIFTGVISYFGFCLKYFIQKHIEQREKKEATLYVYHAVMKLYSHLSEEEKIEIMIRDLSAILKEKGIMVVDLEVRVLIYGMFHLKGVSRE